MGKDPSGRTKSQNITWHHAEVTEKERERLNGHEGATVWLTGLPSSSQYLLSPEG